MRSTPSFIPKSFITERARDLAAMAAAYRAGLASALAAWPVLLGRAIFYGVCLMVLVSFWDKVAAARLAGTLATRLPPGGLGVYIGVTEWITLSIPAVQLRLEDDIRSGALEPHLLRPKPYLTQMLAGEAGAMSARLAMLGAAASRCSRSPATPCRRPSPWSPPACWASAARPWGSCSTHWWA
jgi:ABC-2 type transport system permease protein